MLSLASLRHAVAATSSIRQVTIKQSGVLCRLPQRRGYASENGKDDKKPENVDKSDKDDEPQSPQKTEAPKDDDTLKQLAEKDKKIAELQATQDAYLRALADQENLRQRSSKEITSAREYAIQKFAKDILETVDILGMALASVPVELRRKETAPTSQIADDPLKLTEQLTNLYTGVSMTEAELVKTLRHHGVEQHNPEGEMFDPNKHQALFQTPIPDKEPGTVFSVQKLGYVIKDRILRPAQVGVVAEKP
ncbi:Mitochondrial matrix cochaperone [Apophysomyces sp. BC1034]|nr:Mitochondrial matrix cochaperone [Apophysomyces sp. BC1015]KAG0178513.1 Mitochondrial matrix cochaperone [Apophysomyces sp. BC1021]KAG0185990.1 Mitochondrial matrix cochaperone [Apophysomyces sp. BC1034]